MTRYCFALDLKDDPQLIAAYEQYHQSVWPEIIASIKEADIKALDIYRVANRLFMIMEVGEDFSFEKKAALDAKNEIVVQWEKLMWEYQQALPTAQPGEKWVLMQKIFSL
ncbi:MAG: L-rhamnose mutarotase [Bacteroidetes bacterium]|nr:L-rhamnose mutarotase [Bacteroidota bacterium]MCX6337962.1 L-rhamnose mutarotase [Bacteroidota bacterium]